MTLKIRTLLLLLLPLSLAQQYFINLVPGYTALPACAQNPVSTIVRGMVSGCGNTQYSSYSCFCTASSAKFVSVISSSVAENCPPTSSMLVSSALDVFADYCRLGGETGPASATTTTTTSVTRTTSASATATAGSRTGLAPIPSSTSNAGSLGKPTLNKVYVFALSSVMLGTLRL
ncbi:hypothetical protein DL546_001456 [Coniochaeta pulveracea]|uniref:CFEM domain-containing protein n=1 Tax=Coniochaeta pulveracea TaxID=177199 RepID=A0A420YNB4_9PEZI|nr:hypothetical protein DL546_001456 [Coniochaeta pulveracea]